MGKKGRDKKPRSEFNPPNKTPRGGGLADRIPTMAFSWRLNLADMDGDWGWSNISVDKLFKLVIAKLHEFESMKWADVEGPSGSHFVAKDDLCDPAQDRLVHLKQQDIDQLFSLRIACNSRVIARGERAWPRWRMPT